MRDQPDDISVAVDSALRNYVTHDGHQVMVDPGGPAPTPSDRGHHDIDPWRYSMRRLGRITTSAAFPRPRTRQGSRRPTVDPGAPTFGTDSPRAPSRALEAFVGGVACGHDGVLSGVVSEVVGPRDVSRG